MTHLPKTLPLTLLLLAALHLSGQRDRPLEVTLLDGNKVSLYERYTLDGPDKGRMYAPFNLRVAEARSGDKEFSFLAYRQDSTSEILGGILHFLLTWGPTDSQERELKDLVRMRTDSSQYVAGSLPLERDTVAKGLEIGPPDHPLAQLLLRGLNSKPSPPVNAGGKMAASFSFSAADAKLLAELLPDKEAWQEVYLRIHLKTFAGAYRPVPPTRFSLTKSFSSCLESL
ncbi:hypothetical protein FUA23_07100 [Neolewinella aurantiaca]|uniref:Uncharacterized protein n=1 Tax=Neolewinella aurantiaca TaxID=2602767 RepID=A0A5C7FXN2_9BACT|nr:hypothetical protein [Neolewinella aurantiaca]TXF90279.1 hypothetical protein FUA23_07100 [Neolewinella aurantiaca]